MENLEGQWLCSGRYYVKSYIGGGGMADVYRVWDRDRSVDLAMKVIKGDLAEDTVFLRRFQREAQALAKLDHPSIVRSYGLVEDGLTTFILMDFIIGTSLGAEIKASQGPLSPARILNILEPICAALDYAHQSHVVHCDIKPGNILIDQANRPYLADFGIARMLDTATTTLTMAGVGTADYMSPEQIRGENPAPTMDIYALGVLLFAMVTGGKTPFIGDKAPTSGNRSEKVRWEQQNLQPPSPTQLNPLVPGVLSEIILKCIDKDPSRRYSKPMELFDALKPVLNGMIFQKQNLSTTPRPEIVNQKQENLPREQSEHPVISPIKGRSRRLPILIGLFIVAISAALWFGLSIKAPIPLVSTATVTLLASQAATQTPLPTSTHLVAADTPTVFIATNPPQVSSGPVAYTWSQPELIDSSSKSFGFAALVIDASDVSHLVYLDDQQNDFLRYKSNINGIWKSKSDVSSIDHDGFYNTLLMDSEGVLHLSHYIYANNQDTLKALTYSKYSSSLWLSRNVVNSKTIIMGDASMAIDSKGGAYFVYIDRVEHKIYYGPPSSQGDWVFEFIDNADLVNQSTPIGKSLAFQMKPDGQPAIAYFSQTEGLKYVEKINGAWQPAQGGRAVDPTSGAGGFPSLAFDKDGNPHIIYLGGNKLELKHAVRIAGQWKTETIDAGNAGWYSSLAIDKEGNLHIGYLTSDQFTLRYVNGMYGSWSTPLEMPIPQGGRDVSISLDSKGMPHIAYCTNRPGQVIYLSLQKP
jgi:serine/threonine protein kinase